MAYRNKTYVCFDGDTDMRYYRLMCAWKQNDNIPFNFYNAHELNFAKDSSLESSIKNQLKDRLKNSKVFVILVGEKTRYLYKFVRWEIEEALSLNLPIICVNLNGLKKMDPQRCPPIVRNELAIHTNFNAKIIQYALENWPASFERLKIENKKGPYYYKEETYMRLANESI